MAQLIKLEDCVSRYEQDVFRYTGQYTRLKRDRWNRVKVNWEIDQMKEDLYSPEQEHPSKSKWWKRKRDNPENEIIESGKVRIDPRSLSEVKEDFREELFQFQLKWASSTIRETSVISSSLKQDKFLRFLVQELPDNYLVLYKPIIQLKKAQTQLDVLLIGPDSIKAIVLLETSKGEVVHASRNRFWECERHEEKRKIINPISAVQRMNYFIESVTDIKTTELKISYIILAQNAYMNRDNIPSYIQIVDQTNFSEWKKALKRQLSPIKFKQLKAAKIVLAHCATSAYRRPEWDRDKHQWDESSSD